VSRQWGRIHPAPGFSPASPRVEAIALLAAAAIAAAVVAVFPPGTHSIYPSCPLRSWTGLACPLCGMTRAVAGLLRGRVAEAAQRNLFVVALLPFLLAGIARHVYPGLRWNRRGQAAIPARAVVPVLAMALLFGVARNFFPGFLGP
jgi:hypothetical protein